MLIGVCFTGLKNFHQLSFTWMVLHYVLSSDYFTIFFNEMAWISVVNYFLQLHRCMNVLALHFQVGTVEHVGIKKCLFLLVWCKFSALRLKLLIRSQKRSLVSFSFFRNLTPFHSSIVFYKRANLRFVQPIDMSIV